MLDDNEYFDDQNHFQTLLGNDNTHSITNSTNLARDNLANYLWDRKIQRDNRRNRYNFTNDNEDKGDSETLE
jgi:hypothetical protein